MPYKKCSRCGVLKEADNYFRHIRMADGLGTYCKPCHNEDRAERRRRTANDPVYVEREKAYKKAYRARTSEARRVYMAEWRAINAKHVASYNAVNAKMIRQRYYSGHKSVVLAKTRARQAARLRRTPKWIGPEEHWLMKEVYALAALRTKMTGFAWHVDHEIPLQGKLVSGLHVPTNLRVVPGVENVRKHNRFEVA